MINADFLKISSTGSHFGGHIEFICTPFGRNFFLPTNSGSMTKKTYKLTPRSLLGTLLLTLCVAHQYFMRIKVAILAAILDLKGCNGSKRVFEHQFVTYDPKNI